MGILDILKKKREEKQEEKQEEKRGENNIIMRIVYIDKNDWFKLKEISNRQGISVSAIIRNLVKKYLDENY